jgi:hypothetical protein
MSSEEKKKILQMVENDKISAEEALTLIKALEETPAEGGIEVIEAEATPNEERSAGLEFEEVKARAKKFAMLPLWIGVAFTVLGAYWMFALVQNANYGFWFFCAWFPLLLGLLVVVLSAGGMNSRWLYVNVDQRAGDWPQHITLGFPIPLGIIGWTIRNFGHYIRGMDKTNVDEILMALSMAENLDDPLIVNVDEGDGGDRVQVYIG